MSLTHSIITTMSETPLVGYSMTFFLSMIESLAVIGSLIPGAITMTAAGTLIGTGILSFPIAFLLAIVGALIGDYISYGLGLHFKERSQHIWPFSRFPHWINKGKQFFARKGVWALVIGRFFGPARSMVPFVAGILSMPPQLFFIGIVPSAVLWSIVYLTPGIIIGAVSSNFPSKLAIEFLIEGCIFAFLFWTLFYTITSLSRMVANIINQFAARSTLQLNHGVKCMQTWQQKYLKTPSEVIANLIKGSIFTLIFIWMCFSSHYQGLLTSLDDQAYAFILSFSSHTTFIVSAGLAVLGYYKTFILAAALLASIALYQRNFYRACCFILSTLIAVGLIKLSKHSVGHLRPEAIRDIVTTFSFPSGHTGITAAFLFFFSILLKDHPKAKLIFSFSWITVIIMALSRMFLGVHWLSDVVGGATLGLASAHLAAACYYARSEYLPHQQAKSLAVAMPILVLISWAAMMPSSYPHTINQLTRAPQLTTISHEQWVSGKNNLPHYRKDRLGIKSNPLNIQTMLSVQALQTQLEQKQWDVIPDASSLKNRLIRHHLENYHMPFLNLLHHNKPPVLIMSSPTTPPIILRLWNSGFSIENQEILVGTINEVHPSHHKFLPQIRYSRWEDFTDGLTAIRDAIQGEHTILESKPSKLSNALHWNRQIILIDS